MIDYRHIDLYHVGVSGSVVLVASHLSEEVRKLLGIVRFPDSLSSATFRRLDHNREADPVGRAERLFCGPQTAFLVGILWYCDRATRLDVRLVPLNTQTLSDEPGQNCILYVL